MKGLQSTPVGSAEPQFKAVCRSKSGSAQALCRAGPVPGRHLGEDQRCHRLLPAGRLAGPVPRICDEQADEVVLVDNGSEGASTPPGSE